MLGTIGTIFIERIILYLLKEYFYAFLRVKMHKKCILKN